MTWIGSEKGTWRSSVQRKLRVFFGKKPNKPTTKNKNKNPSHIINIIMLSLPCITGYEGKADKSRRAIRDPVNVRIGNKNKKQTAKKRAWKGALMRVGRIKSANSMRQKTFLCIFKCLFTTFLLVGLFRDHRVAPGLNFSALYSCALVYDFIFSYRKPIFQMHLGYQSMQTAIHTSTCGFTQSLYYCDWAQYHSFWAWQEAIYLY